MYCIQGFRVGALTLIHTRKLTWKPKKWPIRTTVLLKEDNLGFHVSLGEGNTMVVTPRLETFFAGAGSGPKAERTSSHCQGHQPGVQD